MSKRKVKTIDGIEMHEGSANGYADLGYPHVGEMQIKAKLVSKIADIVRDEGLTLNWH